MFSKENLPSSNHSLLVTLSTRYSFSPIFPIIQNCLHTRRNDKDIIRIYDWIMEAASILLISRDSFYVAISITKKIFENNFFKNCSEKIIEGYVGGVLSLAAKVENSSVNFPEAISKITCKRIEKESIIEAQISIMKQINYFIPYKAMIFESVVEICNKWHSFVIFQRDSLKLPEEQLVLGQSPNVKQWPASSQTKLKEILCVMDAILLQCHEYKIQKAKMMKPVTLSLFIVLNTITHEFFPLKYKDKTALIILFQSFLSDCFGYKKEQVHIWMSELIGFRDRLNIIQNVSKIHESAKGREGKMMDEEEDLHKQTYRTILGWI